MCSRLPRCLVQWLAFSLGTFCVAALARAADIPLRNLLSNPQFTAGADHQPKDWRTWSPRPDLAPKSDVVNTDGGSALQLQARRFPEYGKWTTFVSGIEPGNYYRFEVLFRAQNIVAPSTSVIVLASWYRDAAGSGEIQRDYIDREEEAGAWRRAFRTVQAPAGARAVKLELGLRWTENGSVQWKAPLVAEVPPPKPRVVRVATTRIVPAPPPTTVAANTQLMAEMLDQVGPQKPDIVLFSENLVDRATRRPLSENVQTIPGPLTDMLSERARRYHTYVLTTLHERDETGLYHNTAVLIDRAGRIAGLYRKVHLTIEEADWGLTPGNEYKVFETDFGKIGVLTCWDDWFLEPARILRLKGAEILFLPLAGDGSDRHFEAISRARAWDNGLFFVSSGTVSDSSRIIDPDGNILGEARGNWAYVIRELDLNKKWWLRYLGEGKSLYIKERRPETYGPLLEGPAPVSK
jgi:predicted amidohydrolase